MYARRDESALLSEHPAAVARDRAREQWDGEIARLALASLRAEERERARTGRRLHAPAWRPALH